MYALFQCFFMLGNYKRCISLVAFLVLMTPSLFITTNMNSTISTVLSRHVFVSGPSVVSLQNDTRPKVGDVVQVRSPACHPNRSRHMQHNKCCEGTGCCPFGIAKVVQGQKVTWTSETELVIVAPEATRIRNFSRGDSRSLSLSWIRDQSIFPYVLCPSCTVEINPVCSVKSNQGYESSAWLSFIVNNYDRLPKTVAFVHGHWWLQFGSPKRCRFTNVDRMEELRPFLNENLSFIYLSLPRYFQSLNLTLAKNRWEQALQLPFPQVQKVIFQVGPHFVVGRNKILSHPKEFYEKLWAFSSGVDYPGSNLSTDRGGMANGNGHVAAGVFALETWWNLILNEKDSWQHPENVSSLRCQLHWCNNTRC